MNTKEQQILLEQTIEITKCVYDLNEYAFIRNKEKNEGCSDLLKSYNAYIWSYVTNHKPGGDPNGYYYILWQVIGTTGAARLRLKSPYNTMINHLKNHKDEILNGEFRE